MKDIKLTKERIDEIFQEVEDQRNPNQVNYIIKLYREVYPNWDDIATIDGYPKASKNTCLYIMEKAMTFDRRHHPDVMNGGAWMNKGFSQEEKMGDWIVEPAPYTLEE